MSRGMSLGDLTDYKPLTPLPPVVPKPPVQLFPNQYVLFADNSYYTGAGLYPWTNLQQATLWTDRTIPEGIVERWNKGEDITINGMLMKGGAVIGGRLMKDNVKVVDVTKILKLFILKIGGINYYTGGDWAPSPDKALAYRNKNTLEKIMNDNKMSGYSEILEIPLDREHFV